MGFGAQDEGKGREGVEVPGGDEHPTKASAPGLGRRRRLRARGERERERERQNEEEEGGRGRKLTEGEW